MNEQSEFTQFFIMKTIYQAPISLGELYDKITILEIKLDRISDPAKRENVMNELKALSSFEKTPISKEIYDQLKTDNEKLWEIEDKIREKERKKEFDDEFIQLARSVYFTNDQRSETKKLINVLYGSELVEEKSYERY